MLTGIPCRGPLSFSGTASSSAAFASASLSFKYHKQVEKLCMMNIQEMQKREAIFFNIKAVPVICGDTKNYLLTVFVSIIL